MGKLGKLGKYWMDSPSHLLMIPIQSQQKYPANSQSNKVNRSRKAHFISFPDKTKPIVYLSPVKGKFDVASFLGS